MARRWSPRPGGGGAIDATFNALRAAIPNEAHLKLYSVGRDHRRHRRAGARVTVRLEEGGKLVDGQGADADTIVASARAYVHALNKLLVKRERTAPEPMVA